MQKIRIIAILLALGLVFGCAGSIQNVSENYTEMSSAIQDFAEITSKDWLFGSGAIQEAIPEEELPAWVFTKLKEIDKWFLDESGNVLETPPTLNQFQLGRIVGVRIRLAGPILQAALKQYAPALLGMSEVGSVLAFIGL